MNQYLHHYISICSFTTDNFLLFHPVFFYVNHLLESGKVFILKPFF